MKTTAALLSVFLLASTLPLWSKPAITASNQPPAVYSVLAKQMLADMSSAEARRSIRGAKSVWTQLIVEKAAKSPGLDSLEADLKSTDMEGQLRDAGFKVMDPQRKSLALGLRPTVVLSVLYRPKGTEGSDSDFYLVTVRAVQDLNPLGGETITQTTWAKVGEPIVSTGDVVKDVAAIRASAREAVLAFIKTAQDKE